MQNYKHFNNATVEYFQELSTIYAADKMSFKIWKFVQNNCAESKFATKCQIANQLTNQIYAK